MRCFLAFLALTIATKLYSQNILPSFDSELIEEVWIDSELKQKPSQFYIKKSEYNKKLAKLQRSQITLHYSYLKDGTLKEIQFRKGEDTLKAHYYDVHGRIIEQRRYEFEENMPKIVYEYDDKDRIATETIFKLGERIHSKTIVRYNNKNQIIAKEEYRGRDRLNRLWKYHYNDHDDLVSNQYYDVPGQSSNKLDNGLQSPTDSSYSTYQYDSKERKIARHNFQENILKSKSNFAYYPDSLVQQTTFYRFDGKPNERHLRVEMDSLKVVVKGFFYNGDTMRYRSRFKEIYLYGDLIEYESRTLRGTYVDRYTTFYEYDEMGNWIKKTTYSNGLVTRKEERVIRY